MKEIWFGLADVKSTDKNADVLDGAKGAFVNILALASSESDYNFLVSEVLKEYGLDLLSIEDVNPLKILQLQGREFADELVGLKSLLSEENLVQFDEFQVYVED
jgi:hypothetical protein